MPSEEMLYDLVVIGTGPGGYARAIRQVAYVGQEIRAIRYQGGKIDQ
jgi:pyruvate/2-oxoglutarate dehydrogenase complex dihydrolipoamide dehydrogenase (E3) component